MTPDEAARWVDKLRQSAVPTTEDVEHLHHLLASARAQPSQAWAELLVRLATDAHTATWLDVRRRATFEVARQTLLAMGYPYAFQLEPEVLLGAERVKPVAGRALVLGGLALLWNLTLLVLSLAAAGEAWSARSMVALSAFGLGVLQGGWSLAATSTRSRGWLRGLALLGGVQLGLLATLSFLGRDASAAWLGFLVLGAPTLTLTVALGLRARAEARAEAESVDEGAPGEVPAPPEAATNVQPISPDETAEGVRAERPRSRST